MANRLYVDNLAEDVAAGTVQNLFDPHGFVMEVNLTTDGSGRAPGVALVSMATHEAAGAAIRHLQGTSLHGQAIRVESAPEGRTGPGGAA